MKTLQEHLLQKSSNLTEGVNWKIACDRKYVWTPKSRYMQMEISGHAINYSYLREEDIEELFMDVDENIVQEFFKMKPGDYIEPGDGKIYFCIQPE